MELNTDMIAYCEEQPWDDDGRQDVYEKILTYEGTHETSNNWLSRLYTNVMKDRARVNERRLELEKEAKVTLLGLIGDDDTRDPSEYLAAEEAMDRLCAMSPLLYHTLRSYLFGVPIKDIARGGDTTEAVIYKRIQRAKDIIGDTNGR